LDESASEKWILPIPAKRFFQAAERMHQRTVGVLVILDGDRRPIGIVTDRDLVVRAIAGGRDPYTTTVADVMTRHPQTVGEETAIESALSVMRSGAFRRLPVVNHDDRLVGLVTLDDILMLLCEEFQSIGSLLRKETPVAAAQEWASSHAGGI
jgi:CBS domain-containing protein